MENIVNFEISRLLKENGFNLPVHQYYEFIRNLSSIEDKTWKLKNSSFLVRESDAAMFPDEGKSGVEVSAYSDRIYRDYNFKTSEDFISAPTIAEVVMWLYEKHGIWIQVSITRYGIFYCNILKKENTRSLDTPISWEMQVQLNDYNSPIEAYENVIKYCLTNLIKNES